MATMPGTYGHYREEGAVFEIEYDRHFSKRWMVEITQGDAKKLQEAAQAEPEAEKHVVDTSVVVNAELEALRAELAAANAENERLRREQKTLGVTGKPDTSEEPGKTVEEVLAMANDPNVEFLSFKAAARKILGPDAPSTKAELIAALEDKATQPD
jgi:hypothetical protein